MVNRLDSKSAVTPVNSSDSRDDESPKRGVDGKSSIYQVAAVSKTFKSNYTRIVKCQNCGTQHPAKQRTALGKTCFSCGKRNHFANLCRKPRQASLNTVLATLGKSSSILSNVGLTGRRGCF